MKGKFIYRLAKNVDIAGGGRLQMLDWYVFVDV